LLIDENLLGNLLKKGYNCFVGRKNKISTEDAFVWLYHQNK